MVGAVESSMWKVAMVNLTLPHASVAVKRTVAVPSPPHSSDKAVKLLLHVTSLHASSASAPPLLFNQASNSATLPAPSHSTVKFDADVTKTGSVVSSTVNVAVVALALPAASVTVKVTVTAPAAPQSSVKPL